MFTALKERLIGRKFDLYKDEIRKRNLKNIKDFIVVGVIISLVAFLIAVVLFDFVTFHKEFFLIFSYFVILFIISHFVTIKNTQYITLIFYVILTPLMVMAIMLGTFLDNEIPSITIMIFICTLTLFILDKPWRIIQYIVSIAVIYAICCFKSKDYDLFMIDLLDIITFSILSIGVNIFILKERISNVENYVLLREKCETDLLTGIYNRGTGVEKVKELIQKGVYGAFIIIDIDNFKQINDKYGHMNGDKVLQAVSKIINSCFKEEDIVFRLGGDEIAVFCIGIVEKNECKQYLDLVFKKIKMCEASQNYKCDVSISLGCSFYNHSEIDFENLYINTDKCLYQAKNSGKGNFKFNE